MRETPQPPPVGIRLRSALGCPNPVVDLTLNLVRERTGDEQGQTRSFKEWELKLSLLSKPVGESMPTRKGGTTSPWRALIQEFAAKRWAVPATLSYLSYLFWSGREDSNLRPLGPKPSALPGCATPRT